MRPPVGVAAAAAALALGSGCGGDGEATTVTRITTEVRTQTVTETRTASADQPRLKRKRGELSFRGDGDRRLPPIRVRPGGATLRWTNDGPVFSLIGDEGIIIDSVARSGSTYLPAGRHALEVIAAGSWAIAVSRARRAG